MSINENQAADAFQNAVGKPIRNCVLVLGMHRSGTSAIAGTIAKLGAKPPKTLLGANESNLKGHWESAALIAFHEELLAHWGSRWDDWNTLRGKQGDGADLATFRERAAALVEQEFGDAAFFVLKDPRICRFVPFWFDVFADLNITTRIIMPVRQPLEVAQSLKSRDHFSLSRGLLLWLRYVLDAELATRGRLRSIVLWDEFLASWRHETMRISEELDLHLEAKIDASDAEIEAFVTQGLKHQRISTEDAKLHPDMHEWIVETFEALSQLSIQSDDPAAQKRLDDIRAKLDVAERLLGRAMKGVESELSTLYHERDAWEREARHIAGVLEGERQAFADTHHTLEATVLMLEDARAQGERSSAEAATQLDSFRTLEATVSMLEDALAQGERSSAEAASQLDSLRRESESQHRTLTLELSEALSRQQAADARIATLEADLGASLEAVARVTGSRSWKLTAPLRATISALQKVRSRARMLRGLPLKAALRHSAGLYNRQVPLRWRRIVPASVRHRVRDWLSGEKALNREAAPTPGVGEWPAKAGRTAVFVTHDANIGGAPAVLASIAAWFQRHTDYDVRIVSMCGGPRLDHFQSIAPTFVVGSFEVAPSERDQIRKALEAFIGGEPAFVLVNSVAAGGYCAVDPYQAPLFAFIHELSKILAMFPGQFTDLMDRSTHVFCDGPSVLATLAETKAVPATRLSSRPSFIDVPVETAFMSTTAKASARERLGWSASDKIVLGCGIVHWRKQPEVFVRTAANLARAGHQNVRFVWIGDGEDLESMKSLAKRLGVANSIEFIGHHDNFRPYFQAADVFALTSVEDPFPLVCLEAAAASMPLVIFREAGGMSALVEPRGENPAGIAVPLGDEHAFSEALSRLLLDDELRETYGRTALERLKSRFATDVACLDILLTIRKLADLAPRVSVVVPSYNCALYLDQRLSSIATQTFRDVEILLLDDCSQDDSRRILEEFSSKHPESEVFFSDTNSGSAFKAWKRGIERAKGELIWLAEADDWCEPDFLKSILPAFAVSGVRLAYGRSIPANELGEVVGDYNDIYLNRIAPGRWSASYSAPAAREMRLGLGRANSIPNASAVLVRREAALRAVEIAQSFKLAGDWAYYVAAAFGGRISYVHEATNYHRRHERTITRSIEGTAQYFSELADVGAIVRHMYGAHDERDRAFAQFLQEDADRFGFKQRLPEGRVPVGVPPRAFSILYGVGDLSGGGAQMFGVRFVNGWVQKPAGAVLFKAAHEPDHPALRSLVSPSVPLIDAEEIATQGLSAFMEDWGLDLIITGHWWADRAVGQWMEASPQALPWVIVMHGCYENVLAAKGSFPDYLQEFQRAEKHCAHWVWTAHKNKLVFEEGYIKPRSSSQIVNGFAPVQPSGVGRRDLGLPEHALVFTLASRAIEEKGWNVAVAAFQSVRRRCKSRYDVRLQLIGQGPAMDEMKSMGTPEGIHLVPHTGRLADYIHASDVCLLPSWFAGESLPLVLIEFLAQGKPAIVSEIGMCAWAISSDTGPAGLVVGRDGPNRSVSPKDLEVAIMRLVEDPELRATSSANALHAFRKFDFQTMIACYDAVFSQLMKEHSRMMPLNGQLAPFDIGDEEHEPVLTEDMSVSSRDKENVRL